MALQINGNHSKRRTFMSNIFFNIFPSENFIDLDMYQHGYEQCDPGHSFGPLARNHYLFHYGGQFQRRDADLLH